MDKHGDGHRMLLVSAVAKVGVLMGVLASFPAQAAPVEYVRVCDVYGVGHSYNPGTASCIDNNIMGFKVETEWGTLRNSAGTTVGVNGFTGEATGNSAFGRNAWAGGDPNGDLPMAPPRDPSDPDYSHEDAIYAQVYADTGGIWPRQTLEIALAPPGEPGDPDYDPTYADFYEQYEGVYRLGASSTRYPKSNFANAHTTAVGYGAQAGAGALGQDNATAVGSGAIANALNATAIGQGAQANAENAVALGRGSIADVADTVSVGSVGAERRIVNVAAGVVSATSTEALVGSQLHGFAGNVAAALGGGAAVDASGGWTAPSYAIQGSNYDNAGDALGALDTQVSTNTTAISDLASDVGDLQDDVASLQSSVSDHGTAIGNLQDDVSDLQTTVASQGTAIGAIQDDVSANTTAIGDLQTDVAALEAGQAAASGRIDDLEGAIADGTVGLVQQDPTGRGLTVGATTDGETVDFSGTDGERRLTGVAAGVMGTDVVNLAQMEAAITAASASGAQMGSAPAGASGPSADGEGAFAVGYGANADGKETTALGTGAQATFEGATAIGAGARATADPTTAVGYYAAATGNNASAFGGLAEASGENSTAIGERSVASATGATALGRGAVASVANSVALGTASVASRGAQAGYAALGLADPQNSAGEVSVGVAGGERQITNVAAGSAATDAVNVEQLSGVRAEALAYTDRNLGRVLREAEAGTAAAMAAAGLVQATKPGSSMVSGGVGSWGSASAMAIGLSHRFENNWTLKAAGSLAERGGSGMNASVGFEF